MKPIIHSTSAQTADPESTWEEILRRWTELLTSTGEFWKKSFPRRKKFKVEAQLEPHRVGEYITLAQRLGAIDETGNINHDTVVVALLEAGVLSSELGDYVTEQHGALIFKGKGLLAKEMTSNLMRLELNRGIKAVAQEAGDEPAKPKAPSIEGFDPGL